MATNENWPPNYTDVFLERQKRLLSLRKNVVGAKAFYKEHPLEFIEHWVMLCEPRNAVTDLPVIMPFILFQRQREYLDFLWALVKSQQSGLLEKSRDMGATWMCSSFSVWLCLYWAGSSVGWGSRKEELVDQIGNMDSIFEKMRFIIQKLPKELLPQGFTADRNMSFRKIINPENGASITGEAGDKIGRGGRKLIYFKDESAHYEHPEMIEASLSDTARIQVDLSSVNGLGNLFHRKRMAGVEWAPGQDIVKGKTNVFIMDWSEHPLKTQEWYDERRTKAIDEGTYHIFASEVDRNYSASVEGIIIPGEWVIASIDAHKKLNFDDSGGWCAALDVADEGGDRNALAKRKGPILKSLEEWGAPDVGATARRAIATCSNLGPGVVYCMLQYDCIGVGAGVKAETNNLYRAGAVSKFLSIHPWNAGAGPLNPEGRVVEGDRNSPLNKDFYMNLKAQGWWMLRRRFEKTYRAIHDPTFKAWKPEELISLPSDLPLLRTLQLELSQPTIAYGAKLKLLVDKRPEGVKSPNLADAVMMCYWPASKPPMIISDQVMRQALGISR